MPIMQSYSLHSLIQIEYNVSLCLLFCFEFSVDRVSALGFQTWEKELGMASYHYPNQMGASALGFQTRKKESGMASYYYSKLLLFLLLTPQKTIWIRIPNNISATFSERRIWIPIPTKSRGSDGWEKPIQSTIILQVPRVSPRAGAVPDRQEQCSVFFCSNSPRQLNQTPQWIVCISHFPLVSYWALVSQLANRLWLSFFSVVLFSVFHLAYPIPHFLCQGR